MNHAAYMGLRYSVPLLRKFSAAPKSVLQLSALAGVLAKHIIRSPVITKASYCFCLDRLCCWRLVSLSSLVAISCSVALSQDLFVVVLEVVAVDDDTDDAEELL